MSDTYKKISNINAVVYRNSLVFITAYNNNILTLVLCLFEFYFMFLLIITFKEFRTDIGCKIKFYSFLVRSIRIRAKDPKCIIKKIFNTKHITY